MLLRNPEAILPFDAAQVHTVAVIGPNADANQTMQGNYYGVAPFLISVRAGIAARRPVQYAKGCGITDRSTAGIAAAVAAAKASDAVVLVIGMDQSVESEGRDRESLAVPGVQLELVRAVVGASKGPVAVVVMSGGPLDLTPLASMNVALLWVGYPGQAGGQAVADVLFGAFNPGGRLPYTIYPADYVEQVSFFDMTFRTGPGRTYRFYRGPTPFPFGHGLSYTTFQYTWQDAEAARSPTLLQTQQIVQNAAGAAPVQAAPAVSFRVTVRNTGSVLGDDVVLAFIARRNDTDAPIKQLFGFHRVRLEPGQSEEIFFAPTARDLSRVDVRGRRVLSSGVYDVFIGPDRRLARTIILHGPDVPLYALPQRA